MTRSIRFPQGADPTKRPEWLKVRLQTNERAKDLAEVIERFDPEGVGQIDYVHFAEMMGGSVRSARAPTQLTPRP